MTIILFLSLCIANIAVHYEEVEEEQLHLKGHEVFGEVMAKYWSALLGAFIAFVFSIFVFGLFGYHTFLVNKALTT